jgi:hypothetical protein
MTKDTFSSWSQSPAGQIYAFLNELPPPFREQLLVRLYGFFEKEIKHQIENYHEKGVSPTVLLVALVSFIGDENYAFQRAILLIGALDYMFSQEKPWPPRITEELMEAAGMLPAEAEYPIRDQPYLEARETWNKLRSKLSYSRLRKLDEKLSQSHQPGNA